MHRALPGTHINAACRRLLVWCLLLALPIYGLSGTLIQLLGPVHFHRAAGVAAAPIPVDAALSLVDFRRANVAETTLTPAQLHELSHRRHPFTRHFHAADDTSVVAIDGTAESGAIDGGSSSTVGSACLTLALVDLPSITPAPGDEKAWQVARAAAVPTRDPQPLKRPPKV